MISLGCFIETSVPVTQAITEASAVLLDTGVPVTTTEDAGVVLRACTRTAEEVDKVSARHRG